MKKNRQAVIAIAKPDSHLSECGVRFLSSLTVSEPVSTMVLSVKQRFIANGYTMLTPKIFQVSTVISGRPGNGIV